MPEPTNFTTRDDLDWPDSQASYADPESGLVIHYDSSNRALASKSHTACVDYWNWCRTFHMQVNGWVDIGYSWMACVHGYILEGRGLHKQQAAQPGGNSTHYSVTLACGPDDEITSDQVNAVRELRLYLMEVVGNSGSTFGHRDFISTSCPGDEAYQMVRDNVFEQPPGAITEGMDDMPAYLGLAKGDSGELVKLLQLRIIRAGFGDALLYPGGPANGVDSQYGDGTAEGVRLCRAYVGSKAEAGYGDKMTAYACDQVEAAVVQRALERLVIDTGTSTTAPALPSEETVTISGPVTLKRG